MTHESGFQSNFLEQIDYIERTVEQSFTELTPEQKKKADEVSKALIEKFNLNPNDVNVVMVKNEEGKQQPVVMHSGDNGLDKGNWDQIFIRDNAEDYMIEVDGQHIDTRTGMTRAAYNALIAEAKALGEVLPDSMELEQNGGIWSQTWLTGENIQAGNIDVPFASVNIENNAVAHMWTYMGTNFNHPFFRPAVAIE